MSRALLFCVLLPACLCAAELVEREPTDNVRAVLRYLGSDISNHVKERHTSRWTPLSFASSSSDESVIFVKIVPSPMVDPSKVIHVRIRTGDSVEAAKLEAAHMWHKQEDALHEFVMNDFAFHDDL